MAKCEEGYLCDVCGQDVAEITDSDLYLRYVVGMLDPEVLLVTARTANCDCRWYLELDWSSRGRTGTVRVDDHGRPFRTSGVEGLPHYEYDTSARGWKPRIR